MKWTEFSFVIKPSTLGGVGVFATHDIPAGTRVFSALFSPKKGKVGEIPEEFHKYCIFLNDDECLRPERFDRMEIGWFLNHSYEPNLFKNGEHDVIAIRDIKAGEEILIDYNQLNEPEHIKEPYYKMAVS